MVEARADDDVVGARDRVGFQVEPADVGAAPARVHHEVAVEVEPQVAAAARAQEVAVQPRRPAAARRRRWRRRRCARDRRGVAFVLARRRARASSGCSRGRSSRSATWSAARGRSCRESRAARAGSATNRARAAPCCVLSARRRNSTGSSLMRRFARRARAITSVSQNQPSFSLAEHDGSDVVSRRKNLQPVSLSSRSSDQEDVRQPAVAPGQRRPVQAPGLAQAGSGAARWRRRRRAARFGHQARDVARVHLEVDVEEAGDAPRRWRRTRS